ncbi:MAG: DUF2062 domain-containing protein [Gammaproteobacteria bacterium]
MPRKFFRRLSAPYRRNQADRVWYLRPFHALLAHPVYFSINRRTVTGGIALGMFIGVLPFVGHTPVAAAAALLLRVNLPVAILSVWVGNPLTYGPIFYGEYLLGAFLLDLPHSGWHLGMPWRDIVERLAASWRPLWLGAVVGAFMLSAMGYAVSNTVWRLITRSRLRRRAALRRDKPQ